MPSLHAAALTCSASWGQRAYSMKEWAKRTSPLSTCSCTSLSCGLFTMEPRSEASLLREDYTHCTRARAHTHTHTPTHTPLPSQQIHTNRHTYTYTHAHTHSQTHPHVHSLSFSQIHTAVSVSLS